jgi:predicted transcriptional regulator of viral defense system
MLKSKLLTKLKEENNGVLCTRIALEHGISKTYFAEYVKKHSLQKLTNGIYVEQNAWKDDFYLLQLRFKEIIFSHETALYLLDLAEREPLRFTVTVKTGYNYSALTALNIKSYSIKKDLFELGVVNVESPTGNIVKCYNAERTICDIIRSRNTIDIQDSQAAIKSYIHSKTKNIPLLLRYSKQFHVETILKRYLEVLM